MKEFIGPNNSKLFSIVIFAESQLLPSAHHLENWQSLQMKMTSLEEVLVASNDWHLLVTPINVTSISKNY